MYGQDYPEPLEVDPTIPVSSLDECHQVFRRWLGAEYDTDTLDAVLAAAAVERMRGDPLWLLVVSGSGNAKTETVQSLSGVGAVAVSTIASEGALLSATSKKERSKEATGGLLRQVGSRGLLVVKDVTSILSMNKDQRQAVLGALREVYDGQWTRTVGTDGGRTLEWSGRLGLVGAVTTKWDTAHSVIAACGDRFVLVRADSTVGRQAAGRRAIGNTGDEVRMRTELADAVAGVLAGANLEPEPVTDEETDALLAAADLVALARTAVEFDYRGDVIDAHAPEMPTRFAKQLTQIMLGAVAVGLGRSDALRLAIRCARDSMPPLRLSIIDDLAGNPGSSTTDVRRRVGKPRATVDRQLQALHMLQVAECEETDAETSTGKFTSKWSYSLAEGIDPEALTVTRKVGMPTQEHREEPKRALPIGSNISGDGGGGPAESADPSQCRYPGCREQISDGRRGAGKITCSLHSLKSDEARAKENIA